MSPIVEVLNESATDDRLFLLADNGKAFGFSRGFDVAEAAACLRYYGGWADKNHGKVIEVDDSKLSYTSHEPIGVVGCIVSRPRLLYDALLMRASLLDPLELPHPHV